MSDKPSIAEITDAPGPAHLGEGPMWDERTSELVWVDISGRLIHRWDPVAGTASSIVTEGDVGAVVLCEDGGMIAAVECELWKVSVSGEWTLLGSVEAEPGVRFNDCRADPRGRLLAGTMPRDRTPGQGALFKLEAGGAIETLLPERTISNGIGWSLNGDTMYYIDSITQRVVSYVYDLDNGTLGDESPFAEVEHDDGSPDGLTVDAEGCVWVCMFRGGRIRRYHPDGTLDREILLPTTNPTCPAFGGPGLRTLYITTARFRLTEEQLDGEPAAGALLRLDVGVGGRPENRFAG